MANYLRQMSNAITPQMADYLAEEVARNRLAPSQPMNTIRIGSTGEFLSPQGARQSNPAFYQSQAMQPRPQGTPIDVMGKRGYLQPDGTIIGQNPDGSTWRTQPAGTYAAQQEKLDKNIERRYKTAQTEKIERELSGSTLKPSVAESAVDKAFAKEYVDWRATGGYADVAKNVTQLEEVANKLAGINPATGKVEKKTDTLTGPVVGATPESLQPFVNPASVAAREAVEEVAQRNLRLVLGAQFTQKEGERLIARAYNPSLDETENYKRVIRLVDAIKTAASEKDSASEYYEQNGTLKGWKGKLFTATDLEQAMDQPITSKPTTTGQFDAEKEARYQAWKAQQGR